MGRVGGQKKDKQAPTLPARQPVLNQLARMNPSAIQDYNRLPNQPTGQLFELSQHELRRDRRRSGSPMILILTAYQPKTVDIIASLSQYPDIFAPKLPALGDIPFATNPALVPIKQVNLPLGSELFQHR